MNRVFKRISVRLGETPRDASRTGRDGSSGRGGVRAARARMGVVGGMGCEPHGQRGSGSRTDGDGRGGRDGITPDSLTRQLPTTPKGD